MRIRMRISHWIELVVTVAVGLALSRLVRTFPHLSGIVGSSYATLWLRAYVNPMLTSIALVQATMIMTERARGMAPRPMGLGRWTSLFAGTAVVGSALSLAVSLLVSRWMQRSDPTFLSLSQNVTLAITGIEAPLDSFALYLLAGWVAWWLAGLGQSDELDYREAFGRFFGGLVIAWGAAVRFLWFI